ncbi:uncharacterized protein DC041_0010699 [Schistosoma bovis]|uniref:BolA protein n=1 Tax=Schistosoma bovis TaxID=6184 RepID=A0A430QUF1_SCHBO|nr:uncharacterized protein DC041_0010699 [Schistosoma bovis]
MKGAIEQKLKPLDPLHTEIVDFSDGCGLKFDVKVVSQEFEGKSLVDRHRFVAMTLTNVIQNCS